MGNLTLIPIGFLLGVLSLQQLASLPSVAWSGLLVLLVPLLFRLKRLRLPGIVVCGFLWALLQAHIRLYPELNPEWEGVDLVLEGVVASLPEQQGRVTRFLFDINRVKVHDRWQYEFVAKVRLSWYEEAPRLRPGQAWRLTVRLKRPWGFSDPGGFDYEAWLYRQGIRATGYVRETTTARRLPDQDRHQILDNVRLWVAQGIADALGSDSNRGVITALAIGERNALSPQQWSLLLSTGTNHLLAISGMHIGLVAGLMFAIVSRGWRLWEGLCRRWPAQRAAALAAMLAAAGYAALAGFSVPSQRALIMLWLVMGAILMDRTSKPGHTLAVALLMVLIWDSLAVLSAGFWLSFTAVAVIVYALFNRPKLRLRWWYWGKIQWILAIGLLPLSLVFFQRTSLISPLANLVAVPWTGLLIVPVVLTGVLLLPVMPGVSQALFRLASDLLDILWTVLQALAGLPWAQWVHTPPAWALLPAVAGIGLILAPKGWPARWVGLILIAPLVIVKPPRPAPGAYQLTLLDVGQGLAAIVETHNHTLIYDSGARFSEFFNAGKAVVVPFLRSRGVASIDLFIVSHGDNDHIGGADAVFDQLRVLRTLTPEPALVQQQRAERCKAGLDWRWDGVEFEIMHPPEGWLDPGNNQSCVLRIANAEGSLLLTADIEVEAEQHLIETYGSRLASDIILIPHHGSRTSSSPDFLAMVKPTLALVSVGYHNQFGFPHKEIVERYRQRRVTILDTVSQGAIRIDVHASEGITVQPGYRQTAKRYWSSAFGAVQSPVQIK